MCLNSDARRNMESILGGTPDWDTVAPNLFRRTSVLPRSPSLQLALRPHCSNSIQPVRKEALLDDKGGDVQVSLTIATADNCRGPASVTWGKPLRRLCSDNCGVSGLRWCL